MPVATRSRAASATTRSTEAGADLILANRGVDVSKGGDVSDVLWALARGDVAFLGDPIGDALIGGDGSDTFRVRDGEVDRVTCGDGDHDGPKRIVWWRGADRPQTERGTVVSSRNTR